MNYTSQAHLEFFKSRGPEIGTVKVLRLNDHAELPTYGSAGAAGMDLYANFAGMRGEAPEPHGYGLAPEDDFLTILPGDRKLIKTGISVAIPRSTYARVAPRSGLAYKSGIDVMAGVIDEDYRGEVGVILINHGMEAFVVKHGDRVAQLIIEKYLPSFVTEVTEHDSTERGAGAFGSTGK